MANRKRLSLALIAVIALVSVLAVLIPRLVANAQELPAQEEPSVATDSVEFSADLRAEEKPVELLGQYAWTSINGNIVQSEYSADPQPGEAVGNACVYGGGAGTSCLGDDDAANASTVEGAMPELDVNFSLLNLVLNTPDAEAEVSEPLTTGARCFFDENGRPQGVGEQPTGEVAYGTTAVLLLPRRTRTDITSVASGETRTISHKNDGGLLGLLGTGDSYVEVEISPNWGWDEDALRAHSELKVSYRGRDENNEYVSDWTTFTARSECGMLMNNGTGSTVPAEMGASALATPLAFRLAEPEDLPTTAPGSPQQSGFISESALTTAEGGEYYLLSTRELDLLDRQAITEALAAARETDDVEGRTTATRWRLYGAEAAGEQIPVLEVELADGAVVQVRPDLPGVFLPAPDIMTTVTQTTTSQITAAEPPVSTPATTSQRPPELSPESTLEPTPMTSEGVPDE